MEHISEVANIVPGFKRKFQVVQYLMLGGFNLHSGGTTETASIRVYRE